jgi:mannosyltransferase
MGGKEPMAARAKALRLILATIVLGLVGAAIWFRWSGLVDEPLWLDEAYSAYAAGKGFDFLWHVVPRYETHPPFYYSLLRLWTLLCGDSLAALRALGFVCGLATMAAILLAARELARFLRLDPSRSMWLMLATLTLAAFWPRLIDMGREVRPYPVMMLVYTVAIAALLRLGRRVRDGQGIGGAYHLYLASLALMLWLHNLGPLYGLALGLALLALVVRPTLGRGDWLRLVGGHVLVAILYLPALMILLDQSPTWVSSTWLKFSLDHLQARLNLLYSVPGLPEQVAAGILALLAVVALLLRRDGWRVAIALTVLAFLPVALSIGLSIWVAPVFIIRTMTAVSVAVILLLATGVAALPGFWRWPALAPLLLILFQLLSNAGSSVIRPSQDWYAALRWLAPRFRPGDVVYAYPNEGALPFDYAARDLKLTFPSRPIPTPVPSLDVGGWHPTGSRGVVSLPRDRLRAIARSPKAQAVPTIWLLRLGPWAYDKGGMFLDELSHGRTRVGRYRDGPIDIVGLRRVENCQTRHASESWHPENKSPARNREGLGPSLRLAFAGMTCESISISSARRSDGSSIRRGRRPVSR